ncbi:hypothetical protein [Limosilactobacillus vaginalis]|uniref:hypothetical protein n=1 Tax=Limosilactobacillus vaginalis TaxID=1633 RepID=UPI00388D6D47
MEVLINSLLMSVLLTGILALVGDGYAMYWAGVEIKFKDKKWRALFKVLPVLSIVILTFLFMRYD